MHEGRGKTMAKKPKPIAVQTGITKVKLRGTGVPLRRWTPQAPVMVRTVAPAARLAETARHGGIFPWRKVVLWQTAACLLILIAAWGMSRASAPWANEAVAVMKSAVTAEIDLDRSLGRLQFVRALLPDAAFVFGDDAVLPALSMPCRGVVAVGYTGEHPGLLLRGAQTVTAPADGEVLGVAWADGEGSVRMGHGGGVETIVSCLASIAVIEGQRIGPGEAIGSASERDGDARVYFEVRIDGKATDPWPLLARDAP